MIPVRSDQAMWMATQGQLRKLSLNKRCRYLDYDESSVGGGSVPFYNGGLHMFGSNCGFQKVSQNNLTSRTRASTCARRVTAGSRAVQIGGTTGKEHVIPHILDYHI